MLFLALVGQSFGFWSRPDAGTDSIIDSKHVFGFKIN